MIPQTNIHNQRFVGQIAQNLIGLQKDILGNAKTHRAMALAQSPDFETLKTFVQDCAARYLERCKWVSDAMIDFEKELSIATQIGKMSFSLTDITDVLDPLQAVAQALSDSMLKEYRDVIAACDLIIAEVNAPLSLWVE